MGLLSVGEDGALASYWTRLHGAELGPYTLRSDHRLRRVLESTNANSTRLLFERVSP